MRIIPAPSCRRTTRKMPASGRLAHAQAKGTLTDGRDGVLNRCASSLPILIFDTMEERPMTRVLNINLDFFPSNPCPFAPEGECPTTT